MYRFSPVMKLIFLFVIMISGMTIQAQMYILNEDFGTTTGTIPPAGWTNTTSAGLSTDLWHFDNPGNRSVGFPVTAPFAIFDSQQYSQSGGPEDVVLETPYFDASVSSYIFLFINHRFSAAPGSQGLVRIFNGSTWLTVATFTGTINNPDTVMLDISAYAGGITNAKIRSGSAMVMDIGPSIILEYWLLYIWMPEYLLSILLQCRFPQDCFLWRSVWPISDMPTSQAV